MMVIAIILYLIGVFAMACFDCFIVCLGDGCRADEGVKLFMITVFWPIALPYMAFKVVRRIFF